MGIEGIVPSLLFGLLLAAQNLVQVDAVVTGREGQRVAGLKAEDFAVAQDGKEQKITQFSYVGGAERRIAVVVDDIAMDLEEFLSVRRALARFIDEELREGDRMSVVYTSHGSGALRQFTADRQALHRAVERMYWRPVTGAQTAFPGMSFLREMHQAIGELGRLPGRKALVLVAPGSRTEMPDVQGIADLASRTWVTVYSATAIESVRALASATGGRAGRDSRTAFEQLHEAAEDGSGYYLVGWNAGRSGPGYHKVQIRARDKSLRVRSRDGYLARTGSAEPWQAASGSEGLRETLISPFGSGDLEVRLSATFDRQEAAGSTVDSLLHIAEKGVRFEADGDDCWKARLEVSRALWGVDPGVPKNDRVNTQTVDMRACGKTADRMRREGVVATVKDRVPSPGAYQVRVVVRNVGTNEGLSGSATQFLAIPDLKRSPAAVSGVTLWAGETPVAPGGDVTWRAAADGDPAVRRFRTSEQVHYSYRVMGAAAGVRLMVLRDGKEVASLAGAPANGVLPLTGLGPGHYVLGVIAAQRVEQWVDFDID